MNKFYFKRNVVDKFHVACGLAKPLFNVIEKKS